jgi:uncharacterized protein (TIGR02145 family)
MKNSSIYYLVIIGIVLVALAITNPTLEKQKELLVKKMISDSEKVKNELAEKKPDYALDQMANELGQQFLQPEFISNLVNNSLSRDNYLLFSLPRMTVMSKTKIIGIGFAGNVIWFDEIKKPNQNNSPSISEAKRIQEAIETETKAEDISNYDPLKDKDTNSVAYRAYKSSHKIIEKEVIETRKFEINEITIGNQIWMSENLNVDRFGDGKIIPQIKSMEGPTDTYDPSWCYDDNSLKNGVKSAKLYNYFAVADEKGLAPKGWHVPSDDEFNQLINFLGGEKKAAQKLISKYGWGKNTKGVFWTSNGFTFNVADDFVYIDPDPHIPQSMGYSVRCIKD